MSDTKITTLIVHCMVCDKIWEYDLEPNQSLYGAAYILGSRHETCCKPGTINTSAIRQIELVDVK